MTYPTPPTAPCLRKRSVDPVDARAFESAEMTEAFSERAERIDFAVYEGDDDDAGRAVQAEGVGDGVEEGGQAVA